MDLFFWRYLRMSRWQSKLTGRPLPFDDEARCMHKVERDLAFLKVKRIKATAQVTLLEARFTIVDYLSIMGEV